MKSRDHDEPDTIEEDWSARQRQWAGADELAAMARDGGDDVPESVRRLPLPPRLPALARRFELGAAGRSELGATATAPGGSVAPVTVLETDARQHEPAGRGQRALRILAVAALAVPTIVLVGHGAREAGWTASLAGSAREGSGARAAAAGTKAELTGEGLLCSASGSAASAPCHPTRATVQGGSPSPGGDPALSITVAPTIISAQAPHRHPARPPATEVAVAAGEGTAVSTPSEQATTSAATSPGRAVPTGAPLGELSGADDSFAVPGSMELTVHELPRRAPLTTEEQIPATRLEPDRVSARARLRMP